MRLNRVLLLAATISLMMFALVFTISCSGDDGKNGKSGASCKLADQEGIDWIVACDDGTEVVLRGGDGVDGPDGKDGKDGENCWLTKSGNGYDVRCGAGAGQLKGTLDGCSIYTDPSNPFLVVLSCGKAAEINICNNQIFNPKLKECTEDGYLGDSSPEDIQLCPTLDVSVKGVKYNAKKQYCGWGPTDKAVYNAPATIYDACGISPDSQTQPNTGDDYNPEEYCRYYDKTRASAKLAGEEAGDWCNGKPINKDGWRTEYCGYANIETKVRSIVTGACDYYAEGGPRGPNELSFGQAYCEVKFEDRMFRTKPSRASIDSLGKTTYSEALCGTSENNKPNNGKWKDEYCGYASEESEENDIRTKVYTGICDEEDYDKITSEEIKAPHLLGYNKGYCEVEFKNRYNGLTTYTEEHFCNEDPTQRPNDYTWKREYCGYADATSELVVLQGICDDEHGPSEDSFNPDEYCRFDKEQNATYKTDDVCDNGDKVNQDVWKGEYCGYAARGASTTSKQSGICDDLKGPNSDEFAGGYCRVFPAEDGSRSHLKENAPTQYSDDFCGNSGKVNEGRWKGEYCGYANKTADDAEKVWTGGCENGEGKHKDSYNNGDEPGYCKAEGPYEATHWSTDFCNPGDPDKKIAPSGPINKDSWKDEYCFEGDHKVSSCKAGLVPDPTVKSTSANKCIMPSAKQRCENEDAGIYGHHGTYRDGVCIIDGLGPEDFNATTPEGVAAGDQAKLGSIIYTTNGKNYAGAITGLSYKGYAGENNCYNKGKYLNKIAQGGIFSTGANGSYVESTCEREYHLSDIPKDYCDVDYLVEKYTFNGKQTLKPAEVKNYTVGYQKLSDGSSINNCYGGNYDELTSTNLGFNPTAYKSRYGGLYQGKIANASYANYKANLGFSWWNGSGANVYTSGTNTLEEAIIKTFTKHCVWVEGSGCKITVKQSSKTMPNNIGWGIYTSAVEGVSPLYFPANFPRMPGFGYNSSKGVCPTNLADAVAGTPKAKLTQQCIYVP